MYTKIQFLEHFDKVDCVYFDFSCMKGTESRKGVIALYFFIGPKLVYSYKLRVDQFRSWVVYHWCIDHHLIYEIDSARVYRGKGDDFNFDFLYRLLTMK